MKGAMLASLRGGRLGQRLRKSGSSALAISTVLQNAVRIVSTMCLTRLLSPDVYGLTGMIMSVFFVITMLSDVGFQAFIVRHHQSDDPDFLSAVWTIHAIRGAGLTLIAILLAWPVSKLLDQPALVAPLAVSAFTFVIEGQASLHQFRALRDGRVQRNALMGLMIGASQTLAAILLAFFMRNIWAIVGSMLVGSMVRVYLSHVLFTGERHVFRRSREVATDLWRFSRVIAASSAMTLVISQVDKLALSRILPLNQFGTYVIAATLASAPTAFAFNYSYGIVYPAVASAWRQGTSVKDTYYQCWGHYFYLYAFGGGGLMLGADLLIRTLYDPRYLPAAHYLNILGLATAMAMLTNSMQEMLVGCGRTKATLELNSVRLAWLVAGGLLALMRSQAIVLVLTIGLIEIPAYFYAAAVMHRQKLIRWNRELSILLAIAAGALVGGAISFAGRILLPNL
jgi:O-antigen/teichoic acid export membrane protein